MTVVPFCEMTCLSTTDRQALKAERRKPRVPVIRISRSVVVLYRRLMAVARFHARNRNFFSVSESLHDRAMEREPSGGTIAALQNTG